MAGKMHNMQAKLKEMPLKKHKTLKSTPNKTPTIKKEVATVKNKWVLLVKIIVKDQKNK